VAWVPEYHLLLVTWAEGESLSSFCLAHPDAAQKVAGAAEWLLTLHDCGVGIGRRYSFPAHLRTLAKWKELLAEVYPEGQRLLGALLARLEERGRELSGWISGPTHRDFTPEHLVVQDDQFTCLDFDEFCQYDPLFDVAHFTAHLRFLGLTRFGALNRFDSLADRFQGAYASATRNYSEKRLNLFKAISYLKLGRFVALVQRPEGWQQMLPELLDEAQRFVTRGD
jgi:Ser/Thr protein kinase RdoA (MazF antagonist)